LALKGLLHGMGEGQAAWGHDVARLGATVERVLGERLGNELADGLKRLARHYIPARYPDAVPGEAPSSYYSERDARAARSDANLVLEAVQRWWTALLEQEGPPHGEPPQPQQ
jgi:HEPN domain-containing protein